MHSILAVNSKIPISCKTGQQFIDLLPESIGHWPRAIVNIELFPAPREKFWSFDFSDIKLITVLQQASRNRIIPDIFDTLFLSCAVRLTFITFCYTPSFFLQYKSNTIVTQHFDC